MKKFAFALVLGFAPFALAQPAQQPTQPAPAAAPVPQVSSTEKMALTLITQEWDTAQKAMQKASGDMQAFQDDFAKVHPGYHFDAQRGPVQDGPEAIPSSAAKPEPAAKPTK